MASSECEKVGDLSKANNYLAFLLYKSLTEDGQNLFFSPFSISAALSMAYCGSSTDTEKEMRQVLGYERENLSQENVRLLFKNMFELLEGGDKDYTFTCANSLVSQRKFCVKESYKSVLKGYFNALFKEADFANENEDAVKSINSWVEEKTNGMIPQLLESLDPSTLMVILNAVYFKGMWSRQFKEKDTFMQYFYNNGEEDNAKLVKMMHIKEKYPYFQGDKYQAVQLPYKGDNISMIIILPTSRTGLTEVESLLSANFITDLKPKMHEIKIELALPKMKLEYSKSLTNTLCSLGMKSAFSGQADFSNMSNSSLCISDVIHKAVLEVNEQGSEAAAATAVMMVRRCLMMSPEFIVDHPFVLVIYNEKEDLVLFMGRVETL